MNASTSMTVPDRLLERAARSPEATAYRRRVADRWIPETWGSLVTKVRSVSGHLIRMGIRPGDRVIVMLPTCIEWEICHLAILAAGAAVVGLDSHETADNIRHVMRTIQPRALIVANDAQRSLLVRSAETPPLFCVVRAAEEAADCVAFDTLISQPVPTPDNWPLVQPDDIATIVFTSGSTGLPKGIPYSHAQICLACDAIIERFPTIGEGARLACWLPLSNLFQRIINLCGMIRGGESYFVEHPTEIIEHLPTIQPTLFIGVPRFFEKVHAGIQVRLASQPAVVQAAMRWARGIGAEYRKHQRDGSRPGVLLRTLFRIADMLLLRRLRAIMGSNLEFMISGSAPLPVWLMEDFHAIGWLVLEAYGTSENVVPIAINSPTAFRFGSVGRPLPQNELRLAPDGELLVRGPGVFGGYLGDIGSEQALDADGFLHTGDYARLDEEGYLWLAGRKSEVFKTSTGRRIAPVPIENRLKQISCVDHAIVFGQERPFPVALVCVTPESSDSTTDRLPIISDALANALAALPDRDRPAGVLLTRTSFTIPGGELTSNLKLRRRIIEAKYQTNIDALYSELAARQDKSHLLVREVT